MTTASSPGDALAVLWQLRVPSFHGIHLQYCDSFRSCYSTGYTYCIVLWQLTVLLFHGIHLQYCDSFRSRYSTGYTCCCSSATIHMLYLLLLPVPLQWLLPKRASLIPNFLLRLWLWMYRYSICTEFHLLLPCFLRKSPIDGKSWVGLSTEVTSQVLAGGKVI